MRNLGKVCWDMCNQQQGPCSYCGNGFCCRKLYEDTKNGCDGTIGGEEKHVCVGSPGTLMHCVIYI